MKKIGNAFALLALAVFGLVFVGCGRKVYGYGEVDADSLYFAVEAMMKSVYDYGEVDAGGLYVNWKGTDSNWLGYATSEAPKGGYKIVTADFGFRYHCTAPAGYKHNNHKDHWVSPDNFKCYADGKKCDRYVSTKLGGLLR